MKGKKAKEKKFIAFISPRDMKFSSICHATSAAEKDKEQEKHLQEARTPKVLILFSCLA
jgi:hypothetical protein